MAAGMGIIDQLGHLSTLFGNRRTPLMHWIFLQPQDVWMFRDAKPFSAGDGFIARSQFPPNPQSIQGAIRTHAIEMSGVDWVDFNAGHDATLAKRIGSSTSLGALKLQGPFLAQKPAGQQRPIVFVPLPLD